MTTPFSYPEDVPAVDYRCRTCDVTFEVRRSVTEPSPAVVPCPAGHDETVRVWSAVAVTGGAPAPRQAAGGCCGGGCCG